MRKSLVLVLGLVATAGLACGDGKSTGNERPRIELEPRFVEFGTVAVGERGLKGLRVRNLTPNDIAVDGLFEISSEFAEVFALETSAQTIAADTELAVSVTFMPTVVGEFRGTVVVRPADESITPLTLTAHGFALEPTLAVDTTSIAFGNTVLGTETIRTLNVTNISEQEQRLSLSGERVRICNVPNDAREFCYAPPSIMAPGETTTIELRYIPGDYRMGRTTLEIRTCSAPVCLVTVELTGTPVVTAVECGPDGIDFNPVEPGECTRDSFFCTNDANAPLFLKTIRIDRAPPNDVLTLDDDEPLTLGPGETFRTNINFCPDEPGSFVASLLIQTDDIEPGQRNRRIRLSGVGGSSRIDVSTSVLDFGPVGLDIAAQRAVLVRNLGSVPLNILSVNADADQTGAFDLFTGRPSSIMPGASWRTFVTARQSTTGTVTSRLLVESDDMIAPLQTVELRANFSDLPACAYEQRPASITFDDVEVMRVRRRHSELVNVGPEACTLTSAWLRDLGTDFALDAPNEPTTFGPGPIPFEVTFAPTTARTHSNAIDASISSFLEPMPRTVLRGEATRTRGLLIGPADIDFGTVDTTCPEVTRTVHLQTTETVPSRINTIALDTPGFTLRGVSPGDLVMPGARVPLTVAFDPTSAGPNTAQLTIGSMGIRAQRQSIGIHGQRGVAPTVENFTQLAVRKADILFVVHPATQSRTIRVAIGGAFRVWSSFAMTHGIDYRIGVVSANLLDGRGRLIHTGDSGRFDRLYDGPADERFVTRNTAPPAHNVFERNLGTPGRAPGSFTAEPFESAMDALKPELLLNDNVGFIRPEASLAVVFVANVDDESSRPVETYVDSFADLKGHRRELYAAHAIVGNETGACAGPNGNAEAAPRFSELATRSRGEIVSYCAQDLPARLNELAPYLFGSRSRFELKTTPNPATLTVEVDNVTATDYSYDPNTNAIVFTEAPAPGANIRVAYRPAC